MLEAVADGHHWLEARVTDELLLADIATGYDVVIMGADKWHQIQEIDWYRDETERNAAIAALPEVAVAPRHPLVVPDGLRLEVAMETTAGISSTEARGGRVDLMAEAARRFAARTGAWVDHDRYDRWLESAGKRLS